MAYAVIHFMEDDKPRVTLARPARGQPTGEDGVMNLLGAFVNTWSSTVMRQGSPGAIHMAMLFVTQEQEAGREIRVLGGEGPLGITRQEIEAFAGDGYAYEASFGKTGERVLPSVRAVGVGRGGAKPDP